MLAAPSVFPNLDSSACEGDYVFLKPSVEQQPRKPGEFVHEVNQSAARRESCRAYSAHLDFATRVPPACAGGWKNVAAYAATGRAAWRSGNRGRLFEVRDW
jgi:hypothetical protein